MYGTQEKDLTLPFYISKVRCGKGKAKGKDKGKSESQVKGAAKGKDKGKSETQGKGMAKGNGKGNSESQGKGKPGKPGKGKWHHGHDLNYIATSYQDMVHKLREREQLRQTPVEERPAGWWAYFID